jgi:hypothetical protein
MTITDQLRARKGYMSLKETAAVLGKHPQTLYKRLRQDPTAIPHVVDGIRLLFDPYVVACWLEKRQLG